MSGYKQSDQLCWTCANAVPDLEGHGCSWSLRLRPVPGWKAEGAVVKAKDNRGYTITRETWHVYDCPKYVEG